MFISKKKIFIGVAIAVGAVSFLGLSYIAKKKKNEKIQDIDDTDENIIDDIPDETEAFEEFDDVDVSEEPVSEKNDESIVEDDKNLKYDLISYLAKNGVDQETISCFGKIYLDILEEIPEEYEKAHDYIKGVINSEYTPELVNELFNKLFDLLYTTMIPFDAFMKYGHKTSHMGTECQTVLVDLIHVIDDGITDNNIEAITAFADLYNFIKYTPEEKFDEETYEVKFKPYVKKFLGTKNLEETPEVVVTDKIENTDEVDTVVTENMSVKEDA